MKVKMISFNGRYMANIHVAALYEHCSVVDDAEVMLILVRDVEEVKRLSQGWDKPWVAVIDLFTAPSYERAVKKVTDRGLHPDMFFWAQSTVDGWRGLFRGLKRVLQP